MFKSIQVYLCGMGSELVEKESIHLKENSRDSSPTTYV